MFDPRHLARLTPRQLAGSYLAFGVCWIFLTDFLVTTQLGRSSESEWAQVVKGVVFVAGSGVFVYAVVQRRDGRLAAERERLRATRNRLESIIDASPVPILALDTDGSITLWNPAAEDTFGWTEAEAVGDPPKFVPEESLDEFRGHLERARSGESLDGVEVRRRTKRGVMRTFSVSTAPIRDSAGDVGGVMAVLVDVTERNRRERDLLRYKRLMENLPVGVFRSDPAADGTFTDANPTLLSMFDAEDFDDLQDHSIADFYVDESARTAVMDRFETAKTATVETRFRTLDDDVFWARAIGLQHVDEEGNVVIDGILEDLTDSKERDRQFEVIDRILRHNFRNTLGVILGHAEMLQEGGLPADDESVERIHASAERLLELTEEERVIVKLLSGEIRPTTRNLSTFVTRQAAAVREQFPNATVEVEYPSGCTVTAVPQVEDAIGELLENAIVHTDHEDPTVTVTGELTDDSVVTHVSDTGPGIPFSELAEFQLDQPIDQLTHGSGLDLWLVYWAVTASDGTIRFDPNEPRGTTVTIELPRAETADH